MLKSVHIIIWVCSAKNRRVQGLLGWIWFRLIMWGQKVAKIQGYGLYTISMSLFSRYMIAQSCYISLIPNRREIYSHVYTFYCSGYSCDLNFPVVPRQKKVFKVLFYSLITLFLILLLIDSTFFQIKLCPFIRAHTV